MNRHFNSIHFLFQKWVAGCNRMQREFTLNSAQNAENVSFIQKTDSMQLCPQGMETKKKKKINVWLGERQRENGMPETMKINRRMFCLEVPLQNLLYGGKRRSRDVLTTIDNECGSHGVHTLHFKSPSLSLQIIEIPCMVSFHFIANNACPFHCRSTTIAMHDEYVEKARFILKLSVELPCAAVLSHQLYIFMYTHY